MKEKEIAGYPKAISLKGTEEIIKQMKTKICKIFKDNGQKGTGFFCKVPYPNENNLLPVLITNNHIINELEMNKTIALSINNDFKELKLKDRIKYTNRELDITIIEIKNYDNINNYLDLDEKLKINKNNFLFKGESIYLIHHRRDENLYVSYGIIKEIENKKYDFKHLCDTDNGSSGSPILSTINNKVIGIHKEASKEENYNIGLFLNNALNDFLLKCCHNHNLIDNIIPTNELREKEIIKVELDLSESQIRNEGLKYLINKDFEKLKEILNLNFNKNFSIEEIKNINFEILEKLTLNENNISNISIFEYANFNKIKELYLNHNDISDIKVFEKVNFNCLEILDLSWNKLSNNINTLENVKFKELKQLILNDNKIYNINVFEKVNFKNLEKLDLSWNKISDINSLKNVDFRLLKDLNLYGNEISDINVLRNVKFEKLEILNLGSNKLTNINILEKVNFKDLRKLCLYNNSIASISVLGNVNFKKLERLDLNKNKICVISILEKVNFKDLKELDLFDNKIYDINVLQKVNFKKLEKLDLGSNKISVINVFEDVHFEELKELSLNNNQISDFKVMEKIKFKNLVKLDLEDNMPII